MSPAVNGSMITSSASMITSPEIVSLPHIPQVVSGVVRGDEHDLAGVPGDGPDNALGTVARFMPGRR